jgi:hypothetical protein
MLDTPFRHDERRRQAFEYYDKSHTASLRRATRAVATPEPSRDMSRLAFQRKQSSPSALWPSPTA